MRITQGRIEVYTYKDGLLSSVAHDLRLSFGRFELELADGKIHARFWPASLRVDGVMQGGKLSESSLSTEQKLEIHGNMCRDVLDTERYPLAELQGSIQTVASEQVLFTGELELKGRRRPLSFSARQAEGSVSGELELRPSEWGIRPFRALLGALRVQDRVGVRFELPVS